MDFSLSEAQAEIRRQVAALARGFGWDYWREKDRKAEYPTEFVRAFADAGWLGLAIPEAYGGAGLGVTEAVLMLEAICASGAGLSGASPVHFAVFPPMPIIRHGSEGLRRRILPEIAGGRLSLAFGVTEPNAGTDTSRIETMARRDGAGWVVKGRKVWTSNARHSAKMLLLARTTPYESAGPAEARRSHALRRRPGSPDRGDPRDREARPGGGGLQRADHRRTPGGGRGRRGRGGPRLLPPARLAQPRARPRGRGSGRDRAGGARAGRGLRAGAGGVRAAHRSEPGRGAPAGPCVGPSGGRLAADASRGVALRPRGGRAGPRRTRPRCSRRTPASRRRTPRSRRSAASGTRRSSTSSACGGRCASTRSRRSPQQMALNYLAERVLGLPKSY